MCSSMKAASRSRSSLARADGSGNMGRVLDAASTLAQGSPRQARWLRPGYAGVAAEVRHALGAEEVLVHQRPARQFGRLLAGQSQHAFDEDVRLPPQLRGAQPVVDAGLRL